MSETLTKGALRSKVILAVLLLLVMSAGFNLNDYATEKELTNLVETGLEFFLAAAAIYGRVKSKSKIAGLGVAVNRRMALLLLLGLAVPLTVAAGSCGDATIRGGARGVAEGVRIGREEIAESVKDGGLSTEDERAVRALLNEIGGHAEAVSNYPGDFDALTVEDKRRLALKFIGDVTASLVRLEAQGVLRFKTEAAQKRFRKVTRRIRQGVAAARIAEASLPREASPRVLTTTATPPTL